MFTDASRCTEHSSSAHRLEESLFAVDVFVVTGPPAAPGAAAATGRGTFPPHLRLTLNGANKPSAAAAETLPAVTDVGKVAFPGVGTAELRAGAAHPPLGWLPPGGRPLPSAPQTPVEPPPPCAAATRCGAELTGGRHPPPGRSRRSAPRRGWGEPGGRPYLPPPPAGRVPPPVSARPRGGARGSDFSRRRRSGRARRGGAEDGSGGGGGGAVPAGGGASAGGRAAVPGQGAASRGGRSLLHCGPAAAAAAAAARHEELPVVALQGGQESHQG